MVNAQAPTHSSRSTALFTPLLEMQAERDRLLASFEAGSRVSVIQRFDPLNSNGLT